MSTCMLYLRVGFTEDTSDFIHRRIRSITGGPPHVVIEGLKVSKHAPIEEFYFESVWKLDPTTGKTGVRGHLPIANITDPEHGAGWVEAEPENRTYRTLPVDGYLPLRQDEAWEAYNRLCAAAREIEYAKLQLAQNWLANRLGVHVHKGNGTPKRWTCSETPVRAHVMPPRWWPCFNIPSIRADDLTPGGEGYASLEKGVRAVIAEHGIIEP